MIQDIMDFLSQADPEVGASIQKEFDREQHNIELIASENIVSKAVLLAMGTCLTNKYAEGYPGKRYYGGCYAVDVTEELARQRACQLFGCAHANVQPHSGANANLAAFFALLQPGDTVLSMNLAHGGHLSHGSPVNISGKYFRIVPYGVSDDTETIDYEQVMAIAKECRPKLILAGASAYPHPGLCQVPGDRRRSGRPADGGHGPHCGSGGRRCSSLPHPLRRCGDHHHPQDIAGSPGRHDPVQ